MLMRLELSEEAVCQHEALHRVCWIVLSFTDPCCAGEATATKQQGCHKGARCQIQFNAPGFLCTLMLLCLRKGEGGAVYFYQNELPYDVDQAGRHGSRVYGR